ncbi:MAG TPA: DNA mismatch repair endonuclease MutL [Nanoarchaeota archaeon]|nr:DNA mismatch repair endonuclease MutL [Nanoarchaeota archaeon]HIH63904.1 DNA mismatch repair endonuclease MutL [Nanoarchaeota archaeon]HIJ09803.1 DNA mismatch repair endonuclease MutL [Nanoarchaeota archaeon]
MVIKLLDNSIINKIAAGEVIERPASVVKELLENSFDSGADEIKIEIYDAGIKKIKISDNGSGMTKEDALISYKRHTTSKIANEEDLFSINSLGFRGEALASIAEISNLKIITKTFDSSLGTFIEVEGGKLIKEEQIGCSNGTIIEVNDLFFNVPARKNFLKSNEIELSKIINIITKYALIKNDVSIKLIHNNKEILNSHKTNFLINNIIFVYGPEIAKDLINVNYEENGVIVKGYISKPVLTRADKSDQSLYVNKRYVKNNIISQAIYEAYKTLLFINRHPVFILEILIDPKEIDVNVHPAKTEIRIKKEELISGIIFNSIKNAFQNSNLIVSASLENETNHKSIKKYEFAKDKQSVLMVKDDSNYLSTNLYSEKSNFTKKKNIFENFYLLGQINKTYIIGENPEGLIVLDQHAAEERVNYEKFMNEKKSGAIKKQNLLTPRIIELTPVQYRAALNNKTFFESLGFNFDDFGNNSIKLTTIPEIFGRLKSTLLLDVINELVNLKGKIVDKEIEERIIRFACRASVKAGEELTSVEMRQLIENLGKTDNPYSCPHGRPTLISFSIADLEKKFKRTGW